MDKIVFHVQGSAETPYEVVFSLRDGNNITATCTCYAGIMGQYCKHRFMILAGNSTAVVSGNGNDVGTVASWMQGSDIEQAVIEMSELEEEIAVLKKKLSNTKKKIARVMND